MKRIFLLLAPIACAFAGVNGVVINGTTGQPQASVMVSLMQPSAQGLQTLATVRSGPDGSFKIDKDIPGGMAMVQAIFDRTSYTEMLPPGSPTSGIRVQVFDTGKDPAAGKIEQHLILVEPGANDTQVTETFMFNNQTKMTFSDPAKGSAEFYMPASAQEKPQVSVTSATGVPIQWTASKTSKPDVYKVDFPIKPGQTRIDVAYSLPPADTFTGKNLDPSAPVRLVTPGSVTLTGDGIDLLGQEPQTQARIYNMQTPSVVAKISGTGSLHTQQADSSDQDPGQPQIEVAPARIYGRFYWILGLTFAILAVGGTMLYRRGTA